MTDSNIENLALQASMRSISDWVSVIVDGGPDSEKILAWLSSHLPTDQGMNAILAPLANRCTEKRLNS